jgi:Helix-hairpin-helix motif
VKWAALSAAFFLLGRSVSAAGDPADLQAVKAVCGKCHTIAIFEGKPRSWDRWNDVFADMTQRGANGTTEQLAQVTRYFLENLTLVNMNASAAEEIAGVLGVTDEVAETIIQRRQKQRFNSIAELRAISGVDPTKLEERKSRISF